MKEHPAFVCKREGHDPVLEFQSSIMLTSWICECRRCGKLLTFRYEGQRIVAS